VLELLRARSLGAGVYDCEVTQTDQFSRRRHDKFLFDSDIAQCVISAKLVLDLIGERESSHPPHYWIPAFAGMTRRFAGMARRTPLEILPFLTGRTGQFEEVSYLAIAGGFLYGCDNENGCN